MPNGVIRDYNLWYNQTLNCSGSLVSFNDSVADSVLMYTFTELEEDTVYVFYVSAETSAGEGEAAMVTGRTREDGACMHARQWSHLLPVYIIQVISPCFFLCSEFYFHLPSSTLSSSSPLPVPSAAPEFSTTAVTATSITITWQPLPLCKQNGVITNYTIDYRMEGGMDMSFSESVVDAANRMHVVDSLTPYTNYTIKMAASTSVGRGQFGPEMTVQTNESSKLQSVQLSFVQCTIPKHARDMYK